MKISIRGSIINSDDQWIYDYYEMDAVSPKRVSDQLLSAGGQEVELEINSPGGYVDAGSEIYTLLREYSGKVTAKIYGTAASAASVIAMAAESVQISPTGQIMIHNAWSITLGDSQDHIKATQMLETMNKAVANAYAIKTGKSEQELKELMDNETWFSAQDAIEHGFADSIMFEEPTSNQAAASSSKFDLLPQAVIDKARNERNNQALNQKKRSPENKKGDEEVKDLQELKEKYPDIYNQAIKEANEEGIKAERERISALNELASAPGASEIVAKSIEEGKSVAETAMEIVKASAKANKDMGEKRKADSEASNVTKVPASNDAATPDDEEAQRQAVNERMKAAAEAVNKSKGARK